MGEARALGEVEVFSDNVTLAMSHVGPDLIQKIEKGQDPLHILGDGTQVRHYTYGGDLAKGIVLGDGSPGGDQRGLQPVDLTTDHGVGTGRNDLGTNEIR